MGTREIYHLVRQTYSEWSEDKASRLAAALAYYALFSIAPLLVLIVLIVGLVFGTETAREQLVGQIQGVVGQGSAELVGGMVEASAERTTGSILATVFGFAVLVFGATGFFANLQDALNTIWGVQTRAEGGIAGTIRSVVVGRLWAFALVVGIGVLTIATFLLSAYLAAAAGPLAGVLPGSSFIWLFLNIAFSLLTLTVLVAAIYKILPDAVVSWQDVWVGAAGTAALLVIGKEAIGFYLARASVGSIYGAAASLVVLLVWIYLFAQILLFGAEFTQVYARRYGKQIQPARGAVAVGKQARAEEGGPQAEAKEAAPVAREGRQPPAPADQEPERREDPPRPPRAGGLRGRYTAVLVGIAFGWLLGTITRGRGEG